MSEVGSYTVADGIGVISIDSPPVNAPGFFSPANVMRLLEVVRGAKTSVEVIATVMKLAKTIARVPVLSRVCNGFIANRMMAPRGERADALILGARHRPN